MKVRDLIKFLETCDPESECVTDTQASYFCGVSAFKATALDDFGYIPQSDLDRADMKTQEVIVIVD